MILDSGRLNFAEAVRPFKKRDCYWIIEEFIGDKTRGQGLYFFGL